MRAKPISIRPTSGGYHVFVNDVPVVETKSKKGCTFDREKAGVGKLTKKLAAELTDSPAVFPLPTNAMHLAHMIGRYVMSLGDIVDGYTSYDGPDKDEFWARAFD